jgi:hypothetical protein
LNLLKNEKSIPIKVIIVPETDEFKFDTSHHLTVYINEKKLGIPKISKHNVKYLAPYWITEKYVDRIYHIKGYKNSEFILGNCIILENRWSDLGQNRRFEYKELKTFNLTEVTKGYLLPVRQ